MKESANKKITIKQNKLRAGWLLQFDSRLAKRRIRIVNFLIYPASAAQRSKWPGHLSAGSDEEEPTIATGNAIMAFVGCAGDTKTKVNLKIKFNYEQYVENRNSQPNGLGLLSGNYTERRLTSYRGGLNYGISGSVRGGKLGTLKQSRNPFVSPEVSEWRKMLTAHLLSFERD